MKKLKVFIVLGVLVFGMSSCVYSLFPIYTEDTLVFLPELVGKWRQDPDYPNDVIIFEPMSDKKKMELGLIEPEPESETRPSKVYQMGKQNITDDPSYAYVLTGDNWSIKSDDPITAKIDGERVSDPERLIAHYDELFENVEGQTSVTQSAQLEEALDKTKDTIDSKSLNEKLNKFGEGLDKLGEALNKLGRAIDKSTKIGGTITVTQEESYRMVSIEDGVETLYQAHVAKIGEDYFLDVYPLIEYSNQVYNENLFPVHTFYKVEFKDGKLNLVLFDLEKLNELFESNLIRLRHEYVDGNVLITAQPKEIQKFLDKYSDDESVFYESGETDSYTKIE